MRTVTVEYVHFFIVNSLVQQTFKNQRGIQDFPDEWRQPQSWGHQAII